MVRNGSDDLVTKLMYKEITSTKPLTRELETLLFKEYEKATENRRKAIRSTIINANLRFALKSCLLYKNVPNVSMSDMMSEAKIGLISAFDSYDYNSGIKFISYAVWQIRHRFSKYFDGIDLIRIPTHQKTQLNKKRKIMAVDEFDDITAYFNTITQSPISLDTSLVEDESDCKLSDILVDENAYNPENETVKSICKKHINESILRNLTDEEAIVIKHIYGLESNISQNDNGSHILSRSQERIRQIRNKALAKLANDDKIRNAKKMLNSCMESSSF